MPARNGPVHRGSMSGRSRQSSSGAASRKPISSSSTCGGASTSDVHRAPQSATRHGGAVGFSVIALGACRFHRRPSGSRTTISLRAPVRVLERRRPPRRRVESRNASASATRNTTRASGALIGGHLGDEHGTGRRRCGAGRSCGRSRTRARSRAPGRTSPPCPSCASPGTRLRCRRSSCHRSFRCATCPPLGSGVVEVRVQRLGDERRQRRARLDRVVLHLLDQRDRQIDVELLDLVVVPRVNASILVV